MKTGCLASNRLVAKGFSILQLDTGHELTSGHKWNRHLGRLVDEVNPAGGAVCIWLDGGLEVCGTVGAKSPAELVTGRRENRLTV